MFLDARILKILKASHLFKATRIKIMSADEFETLTLNERESEIVIEARLKSTLSVCNCLTRSNVK